MRLFNFSAGIKTSQNNDFLLAENVFLVEHPDYESTIFLDDLRDKDFARLDQQKHTYLDFTGGGLYGQSLIDHHHDLLSNSVMGNPHSINPTSSFAGQLVDDTRDYVLKYFNATDDYFCIFTQNASTAIKLVGESYPFDEDSKLLLTFDNHNSVNGLREYARDKGAKFTYSNLIPANLRIDEDELMANLHLMVSKSNKLFAFPAQSNVSGVRHDLKWIKTAQNLGWDVLLDAAAYVPTNTLDLREYPAEFVSISFYKMFGYPTGLGCLLVKKTAFSKLDKRYFAGGTITIVSIQGDGHFLHNDHAAFEEGTVNYLDIPAIKFGLEYLETLGIDTINKRVKILTNWLLNQFKSLRHNNGMPLLYVYGPQGVDNRGGTICMNFYDKDGGLLDFREIEKEAGNWNISLRTGCFCNPGIDETNHNIDPKALCEYFKSDLPKDYFELVEYLGHPRGAVRISLGYISSFRDVHRFIMFCEDFLDR